MASLHQKFSQKCMVYEKWHQSRLSSITHLSVLIIVVLVVGGIVLFTSSVPTPYQGTTGYLPIEPSETIQLTIQTAPLAMEEIIGEDRRTYQQLSISESNFYTQEEGSPQLPLIKELIQIPDQATHVKVRADYQGEVINYNDLLVYPVPKNVVKETPEGFKYVAEEFYLNQSVYQKDELMPQEIAQIKQDGYFRSVRMLEVYIYPAHYNPKQQHLEFYPIIKLNINYQLNQKVQPKKETTQHYQDFLAGLIFNFKKSDLIFEAQAAGSVQYLAASDLKDNSQAIDYLIITHSDFYDSLELSDLATYRANYDLFNIGITQVADIYSEFPNALGNDYSIQDFITYAYHNWQTAPSYLLLLGDVEWVPSHSEILTFGIAENDDWFTYGADGDEEYDDDSSNLAVGRFPVRNIDQIVYIKNKIETYEQSEILPGDYHSQVALMQGPELGISTVNQLRKDKFTIRGFDLEVLEGPCPNEYCLNDVCGMFEKNFVHFYAHGESNAIELSWCCDPTSFHIISLTECTKQDPPDCSIKQDYNDCGCCCVDCRSQWNYNKYPIVMADSCNTADLITEVSEGEYMVLAQDKGAVAYYGATSETLTNYIFDYTIDEIFNNYFNISLGQALLIGERIDSRNKLQILLGDPALHVFSYRCNQTQSDLTLGQDDIVFDSETDILSVSVTNIGYVDVINVPVEAWLYESQDIIHYFASLTIPLVPAQSSAEASVTVEPPLRGEYLVVARIDPANTIDESFKLNNQSGRKVKTMKPSIKVTVLDEDDQPVNDLAVYAYDLNDTLLGYTITDDQGKAKFYLQEGLQVYLKLTFSPNPPTRSYVNSEIITTPSDITMTKPQGSELTVLNGESLATHYQALIYDLNNQEVGFTSINNPTEAEIFDFYLQEGALVYLQMNNINSPSHDINDKIYSNTFIAPFNATFGLFTNNLSGDLTGDGETDSQDVTNLLTEWFETTNLQNKDFNQDGKIDVRDLGFMMSNWSD